MGIASELVMLRMGFEEGLFGRDDVRVWVDREIVRLHELPAALLEPIPAPAASASGRQ